MNKFSFEYLDNKSGDVNKGYTYKWMRSTSDLLGFLTAAMVRDSVMTMPALQVTKDFIFNELNETCGRKISSDFKNGGLTLDDIFVHSMLIDDIEMDKPDEYPYVILSFIDENGEKVVVNDINNAMPLSSTKKLASGKYPSQYEHIQKGDGKWHVRYLKEPPRNQSGSSEDIELLKDLVIPGCNSIEYCVEWIDAFENGIFSENNILPLNSPYYITQRNNVHKIKVAHDIEDLRSKLEFFILSFNMNTINKIPVGVVDPQGTSYDLIQNDVLNEMVKSPTISFGCWEIYFNYIDDRGRRYFTHSNLPEWVRCECDAISLLLAPLIEEECPVIDVRLSTKDRKYMHKQMERYKTIDKHIYGSYINHSLTLKDDKIKDYLYNSEFRIDDIIIQTNMKRVKFESNEFPF